MRGVGHGRSPLALTGPRLVIPPSQVLSFDASNVESIACLASHHFYTDQPEVALKHYRRLLQMGVQNTELWNNLGLCCFYASQYDMTLSCFERALALASDENMADVWCVPRRVASVAGVWAPTADACTLHRPPRARHQVQHRAGGRGHR